MGLVGCGFQHEVVVEWKGIETRDGTITKRHGYDLIFFVSLVLGERFTLASLTIYLS